MSINLQLQVKEAFKLAGQQVSGLLKTVTYVNVTASGVYNVTLGTITNTTVSYVITDAILSDFKYHEVNNIIKGGSTIVKTGDQKLLIPYASLSITPTLDDTVSIDSATWNIISHKLDPTKTAVHIFQIRRA